MRKTLISLLLWHILIASLYAQASFKLLDDFSSPILKTAIEAQQKEDYDRVDEIYGQFIQELRASTDAPFSVSSSDENLSLSDYFQVCYNLIAIYIKLRTSDEIPDNIEDLLVISLDLGHKYKAGNHITYAYLLSIAAYLADDPENIEGLHLNALSVFEKQVGHQHISYADEASRLADFYLRNNELLKAESFLLKAKPVFELHYKQDDRDYFNLLWDLSSVYLQLNNIEKAKEYFSQTLLSLEKEKDVDTKYLKVLRSNFLRFMNSLESFSLYDFSTFESVDTVFSMNSKEIKEHFGESSDQYIKNLTERAFFAFRENRIERSDSLYKAALEIEESMRGKHSVVYNEIMYAINTNATLESRVKRLKELLEIKKTVTPKDYNEITAFYCSLVNCYSANTDSAIYYLSLWQLELVEEAEHMFYFFTEAEREMWWKKFSLDLFQLRLTTMSVYIETFNSSFLSFIYNGVLFSKSMLLMSSQKLRQSIYSSNNAVLINEWNRLSKLKKENNNSNKDLVSQLEKAVVNKSQTYTNEQQYFNVDWLQIKKTLSEGEVAIEFFVINLLIQGEYKNVYFSLLIRADSDYPEIVYDPLFEDDILDAIRSENKDMLYETIWYPLEKHLENNDIIYLAPAGLLHSISFDGLSYGNGKYYLADDYTIHNLLSTRDIIKLKERKLTSDKPRQIVLFGGADYTLPASELALLDKDMHSIPETNLTRGTLDEIEPQRGPGFFYLPGSRREVCQISSHLAKQNWKTFLFVDKEATESRFKTFGISNSPDVIHLSTHGFYFSQPDIDNQKQFSIGEKPNVYRLSDNPLMRSGLAFTGANHVWKGNDPVENTDDGILTAYEISTLNLFDTELVVLSACNTGLGDINYSEGIYGLQRAFRLAGVQTMIVSLREVSDKETIELMTSFYSLWGKGLTKKEAFSKAQKQMREAYPDQPQKWAGFIMIE